MTSRRDFIKAMMTLMGTVIAKDAVAGAALHPAADRWGLLLPQRKLGRTGEPVTMLGVGGYHVGWTTERDAQEVIETALAGGIRFFDTAYSYPNSEERYGKFLIPKYREQIFLMTKSQAADGPSLLKEFDVSRKRLGVDSVDLLQLHALSSPGDVISRMDNGVIEALVSILKSGGARYAGFTGHESPYAQLEMLKRLPEPPMFSAMQIPVSLVDWQAEHSFSRQVLPDAAGRGLGVLAMKTLADGRFFSRKEMYGKVRWQSDRPVIPDAVSVQEALYFVWSLPVSVIITGAENKALLEEKIRLARTFSDLTVTDRERLLERVLAVPDRGKVEYYKRATPAS